MRKKGDLVAEDFSVSSLDEEGRDPAKVAKEGRDVGVRQVLVNADFAEQALDGIERVVRLGRWQVVERLCLRRVSQQTMSKGGQRLTLLVVQLSHDMVKSTHGLMRMPPEGSGYPSSRRYIMRARQSPPPALSPAKTCRRAETGQRRSLSARLQRG